MALRVALSRVVLVLSLISFAAMAMAMATSVEEKCQYLVRVKTGDVLSAGTNSVISLQLNSSDDSFTVNNLAAEWGLMGRHYNYFERDNLDIFSGKAPCLSVCAITVISNEAGYKPGWYLEYVEITIVGRGNKAGFPVNSWVAKSYTVDYCSRLASFWPALSSV